MGYTATTRSWTPWRTTGNQETAAQPGTWQARLLNPRRAPEVREQQPKHCKPWNEPKPSVTRPKRGFGALQAEEAGTKRGEETNTEQQLRDEGQGRGKAAHHSGEGRKAWDTPQPRGAGPHGGPPETRKQPRSQGRGRLEGRTRGGHRRSGNSNPSIASLGTSPNPGLQGQKGGLGHFRPKRTRGRKASLQRSEAETVHSNVLRRRQQLAGRRSMTA